MDYIRQSLKDDYNYVCAQYSPEKVCDHYSISEDDVLRAHYLISDYFLEEGEEIMFGIKNYDLLSSAVHRQTTSFGNIEKWSTEFQKMATLLYELVKNHAFHDGNKRTALLVLLLHMDRQHLQIRVPQTKLETLVVRIAANTLNEYQTFKKYETNEEPIINFIADLLKKYTSPINKRYYSITYAEFNTKLNKFNVRLGNPAGNYINVYQIKNSRLFKIGPQSQKEVKVLQIGFPGWKKQVNPKALKNVLKETHLTAEFGVDSDVFFKGEEPMYALINEYRGPLLRLKDK